MSDEVEVTEADREGANCLYRAVYGHGPLSPECSWIMEQYARAIAKARIEESKQCLSIAMARYGRWTKLADTARDCNEREFQLSVASECEAIADAIAARRGGK